MGDVILSNLRIAVISRKKKPKITKLTKVLRGTVIIDKDGTYKCSVDYDGNGEITEILPFTKSSFELYGRQTVFIKEKDEYGRIVRVIRDELKSKVFPGSKDKYIPFAPNWIVKGYIIKDGLTKYFDFKELVGIDGYNIDVLHDDDDD